MLSVSYSTSNVAVLGELGRMPLSVIYKYKCVKFWLKIVQDNDIRIRNSLYKILKGYDDVGGHNWVSDIKCLLCSYGYGNIWFQQCVGNTDLFLISF